MEPKKMYVESVESEFDNWCSTEKKAESDIEYISVEHLKKQITDRQIRSEGGALLVVNGREIIFVDELLKYIES